jgi:hypothetical protein
MPAYFPTSGTFISIRALYSANTFNSFSNSFYFSFSIYFYLSFSFSNFSFSFFAFSLSGSFSLSFSSFSFFSFSSFFFLCYLSSALSLTLVLTTFPYFFTYSPVTTGLCPFSITWRRITSANAFYSSLRSSSLLVGFTDWSRYLTVRLITGLLNRLENIV